MAILVAAGSSAFAQADMKASAPKADATAKTPGRDNIKPVTQASFNDQVRQLAVFVNQNMQKEAEEKWNEVHRLMTDAMRDGKIKVRDAMEAKNEKAKESGMASMNQQRVLYTEATKLHEKMMTEKQAFIAKLNEYAATIK